LALTRNENTRLTGQRVSWSGVIVTLGPNNPLRVASRSWTLYRSTTLVLFFSFFLFPWYFRVAKIRELNRIPAYSSVYSKSKSFVVVFKYVLWWVVVFSFKFLVQKSNMRYIRHLELESVGSLALGERELGGQVAAEVLNLVDGLQDDLVGGLLESDLVLGNGLLLLLTLEESLLGGGLLGDLGAGEESIVQLGIDLLCSGK
jgi:hypothetical protein